MLLTTDAEEEPIRRSMVEKQSVLENVDFYNKRENTKIFLETSKEQEARIKSNSPYRYLTTWKII